MWILYILIIILIVIYFAIFVFDIRIEICDHIVPKYRKIKKYKSESIKKKPYVKIKILKIITVYKIDLDKVKKKNELKKAYKNSSNDPIEMLVNTIFNSLDNAITSEKINRALLTPKDLRKILKSIYIKKMNLNIGLNLINNILNAYIIALLNALINMVIASNTNKFNLDNMRYKTYISGEVYNIQIDGIIDIKLANIIYIIFKVIYKFRKVENKNVRNKTSDRKPNDDRHVISREYG